MSGTVLIAGATGVVGGAAVERFLGDGRSVVAVSRRKPDVATPGPFAHLPVDLTQREATRDALRACHDVTHVVYAALYETPGLVAGWKDGVQMSTNESMLRNLVDGLIAAGSPLRHISLLQGTKAYGVHLKPISIPAREDEPRDDHPNFYWLQQDYLASKAAESGFAYTIFRPQFIFGGAVGAAMNLIPVLGAYAAICRYEREPLSYPGGNSYVAEGVDARLLADALSWAAGSSMAANQVFNITNGDVFEWRNLWPVIAQELEVDLGPDREFSMVEFFRDREPEWRAIVRQHGLRTSSLAELLGESHHYADFAFGHGLGGGDRAPAFVSTIKLRQAGFHGVMDTADTFRYWLSTLRALRYVP